MVIWTILWFCDISNKNRIGEVKMERTFVVTVKDCNIDCTETNIEPIDFGNKDTQLDEAKKNPDNKFAMIVTGIVNSSPYLAICAYLIVFTIGSFFEDINNVICFFFACLSLAYTLLDNISNKHNFGFLKKSKWVSIILAITIFGTIISRYFGSNWFRNSFSNAISGVLLLCIFIPKFYTSVKTNYKESK